MCSGESASRTLRTYVRNRVAATRRSSEGAHKVREFGIVAGMGSIAQTVLDQMERELAKPYLHDAQDRPLFHYTDSHGLLGLMRDRQIWATHFRHLNDREELIIGERLALEEGRRLAEESPAESARRVVFEQRVKLSELNVYVASMSEEGDLLSQWRAYGANGSGYSIGFQSFRLPQSDEQEGHLAVSLMRRQYDEGAFRSTVADTLKEVADGFEKYLQAYARNEEETSELLFKAVSICLRRIATIVPRLKNPAFREEREWRIVAIPMEAYESTLVRFRGSSRGVLMYVPVDLADDGVPMNIVRLNVGPTQDPENGLRAARMLLRAMNYDGDKLVAASKVPYRG